MSGTRGRLQRKLVGVRVYDLVTGTRSQNACSCAVQRRGRATLHRGRGSEPCGSAGLARLVDGVG